MPLYERIDRDVPTKSGATFEFLVVYAVCFVAMLIPATIRWLGRQIYGDKAAARRSIFGEARAMAANCATTSFMGM